VVRKESTVVHEITPQQQSLDPLTPEDKLSKSGLRISYRTNRDQNQSMPHSSPKTVAVVLSTMRSGSTLLKALLATAHDVSDLPETNFQAFADSAQHDRLYGLSDEPILVLKRPGWFNEIGRYPRLPTGLNLRKIVLVRDVYENVLSIRKMAFRHLPFLIKTGIGNRFFCERYWHDTNARLRQITEADPQTTLLLRYEDMLADPITHTARLFAFIGSAQTQGIDTYGRPSAYQWGWGRDDGGDTIKSMKVQSPRPQTYTDPELLGTIKSSPTVLKLRRQLGYADLPWGDQEPQPEHHK
jgi:hypothetical protein